MSVCACGCENNLENCFYIFYYVLFYMHFIEWWFVKMCKLDTAIRVQILDETDCISHSTNTLGKGMNPIILPPAMGK